jgi:hypothetical protein
MPNECSDINIDEFCPQLSKIDYLFVQYADCHIILCGDFYVEFSRSRVHADLLNTFCDKPFIGAIDQHSKYFIDYTYEFQLERFNTLDDFIMPITLFDVAVLSATLRHNGDNLSDHPILMSISLYQ